jgi:acyl transferase domain-containing protein
VVIVGQAVRLPGDINTPEAFWEALVDMREDLLIPVPQDRWDHASFLRKPGDPAKGGDITFEKAGFVDVASFDNTFFGISAPEAFSVVPASRLVLETTFQALENANIPISRLKGTDTGVFAVGSMDHGYTQLMFASMGFSSKHSDLSRILLSSINLVPTAYSRFHGTGSANSASCGRLS